MDRQHADAKLSGLAYGRRDSVGDVVIFEVEKHLPPRGHQVTHHPGAFGGIKLHAHLVSQGRVAHRRNNLLSCGRRRNVQGDNQSLSRIAHAWGSVEGLRRIRYWRSMAM